MGVNIGFLTLLSLGSDLYLLLREWLWICDESYYDYGYTSEEEKLLPTRVFHVGDPPDYNNMHMYVTINGEKGTYITLSHCWGSGKPLKTTMTNLEDFREKNRV
jgi:hypothetical protein